MLIATGARPIELPGLEHAHTLRTLDDALRLDAALATASHVAIVGAGLIGQEVASAACGRSIAATLIDAAPRPFDTLMGPGGGDHLQRLHEDAGVTLRLGRRLIATHGDDAVELDDGTIVEADVFLVAVGVRPAKWPSRPNVYAAGDVTGSAHWEAAALQGAAAARSMLGLPQRATAPSLVWSDQHGVRIQRRRRPPRRHPLVDRTQADCPHEWTLKCPRRPHRRGRAHEPSGRAQRSPPQHRHPHRGGRMTLTVQIDDGACLAHGDCVHAAPGVFALTGDVAEVVGPGTDEQLRAAARACPAGAILLFEGDQEVDP